MIYQEDIKLLSLLYAAQSNVSKEEKKQIFEFVMKNPIEESMNLLMTGYVTELTESKRKEVSKRFSESRELAMINFLNEQVDEIVDTIQLESWFPTQSDLKAAEYTLRYLLSPVGKAHVGLAGGITNAIANLRGDVWKIAGADIIKPHKIPEYLKILDGSFVTIAAVGAATVGAAIAYLGHQVLKKVFEKYSEQCKGVSGKAKTVCIAAAKANAVEAQIKAMESKKNLCAKTKDPQKCKSKVDKKLNKLKSKFSKMQKDLAKAKQVIASAAPKVKAAKQEKKKGE